MNCNCSDNWDFKDTGNCDPHNGTCLQCLFNTVGEHCEYCKDGFFGDAVDGMCDDCVCSMLGTDPATLVEGSEVKFKCDRFNGDCVCLPNVVGKTCDQ